MRIELKIPKLAVSMEEAVLVEWSVADGQIVKEGDPVYVIESEKTTADVPAPVTGVLTQVGKVNESYKVGALVAILESSDA